MPIQRRRFIETVAAGSMVGLAGCTLVGSQGRSNLGSGGHESDSATGQIGDGELLLATTTSTYDTGLLDDLHPVFERNYGVRVKTIPKGTGASLRTARDGDADVVLVHARDAEDEFIRNGFGVNRRDVMYNDFVVVGPSDDPARIGNVERATEAFATIADREATFVSRGDASGTNMKELLVWDEAGIEPNGQWYQEVGKGMGDTLVQADRSGAYTLADRGTFLSMEDAIDLAIHVQGPLEGGPAMLKNPYGVMAVNPARYPDVNYQAAMAYIGFLTSPTGQSMIEEYAVNGSQLFYPNARSGEPNLDQCVPEEYGKTKTATTSRADVRFLPRTDTQGPRTH